MGALHYSALLAVLLVLRAPAATADFFSPFVPPIFRDICQGDVCGQGNCTASKNSTLGYECLCKEGWKQARGDDDDFLKFLPCVIPNCTFNYTCADAPSPAPRPEIPDIPIFDPCIWAGCGGGTCNKTSPFTRTCECNDGYYNLLNSTAFPCYKQCSFGGDCPNLGLDLKNTSTGSKPSTGPDTLSLNQAPVPHLRVEFSKSVALMTAMALILREYI